MAHYANLLLVAVSFFIIIHPQCFTLSCHIPYAPASSHSLFPTQIEVSSFPHMLFLFPLPQTKFLLLCFLLSTVFLRNLCYATSFSTFKYFCELCSLFHSLTVHCYSLFFLFPICLLLYDSICWLSLTGFTVCRVLKQKTM